MQFVNSAYSFTQNYWNDIPKNTANQVIYNAVGAFALHTVLKNSVKMGAVAGALTATAVLIHAAVSPAFRKIIGSSQLSVEQEFCRSMLAVIGTGCVAQACFGSRLILNELTFHAIACLLYSLNKERCDLNRAGAFYMTIL